MAKKAKIHSKTKYGKAKPGTALWRIGYWATVWWGVTCGYFVVWFWIGKDYLPMSGSFFSKWSTALSNSFNSSMLLKNLWILIIVGWVIWAIMWLQELKRQKIPYKVALKDLFLTIRK